MVKDIKLINILVIFFFVLIVYQIFLARNSEVEGLTTYKQYNTNNPNNLQILVQQNSGNIQYLKEQLSDVQNTQSDINSQLKDISGNIIQLQTQVNGIVASQQQYSNNINGGNPPQITGAVNSDTTTTSSVSTS